MLHAGFENLGIKKDVRSNSTDKGCDRHYYSTLIWPVTNQEPRKTIGYCFENNRLYCFSNPRWRRLFSTNQESNKEFKMASPMKVGHVGKQPTSLNGGLKSVSQISMTTQITPGFSQKFHATSKFTWLTLINRSLFWARKLRTGLEGIGLSDSSDMSIGNQSRHM